MKFLFNFPASRKYNTSIIGGQSSRNSDGSTDAASAGKLSKSLSGGAYASVRQGMHFN